MKTEKLLEDSDDEYETGAIYVAGLKTSYLSAADMVLPLCSGVCLHLFYLAILIPIVILFYDNNLDSCMNIQFDILLLSLLSVHICIVFSDLLAIRSSCNAKASGTNSCLNMLLNIRLFFNTLEVMIVLYGVYAVFMEPNNRRCWEKHVIDSNGPLYLLSMIFLALNFTVLIAMWCCLCCCLSSSSFTSSNTNIEANGFTRFVSAAVFGEEASKVTSSFYGIGGLINILSQGTRYTPAEITTGLHLLRMLQKHYGQLDENCEANKTHYKPLTDNAVLHDCELYTLYANAAYGIPLYSMTSPCAICCAPPCCLPTRFDDPYSDQTIPDQDKVVLRGQKCVNSVQIDNSSFKVFVKRTQCEHPQNDVLLVAQIGGLHKVNFYVMLDHHKQALVIAIRGTLSIGDTITDANTEPALCTSIHTDVPCYMHKGIAHCAQDVFDKIMQSKAILNFVTNAKYKHYDVVVCGHSLGGGTTVILSILMRYGEHEYLKYFLNDDRTFKAYAIAPPSCIDRDFALKKQDEMSTFLTCVIVGHDLVPRLSFHNLIATRAAVSLLLAQLDKTNHGPWWVYRRAITANKNTILEALPEDCIYCDNVSCVEPDVEEQRRLTSGQSCFVGDVAREIKIMRKQYDDKLQRYYAATHEEDEYKHSELCINNRLLWDTRFCQAGEVIYIAKKGMSDRNTNDNNGNECCKCSKNVCSFICRSMILNACQCRCCLDPKDTEYQAYLANIDIFCDNMLFSKDMIPDHMAQLYLDALKRLQE